jgi:CRISPR-associated protein Csx17
LTESESFEAAQRTLIALRELIPACAQRPKLLKTDKKDQGPPLPTPPRLPTDWIAAAEDGSHEFALAAALASIDATAIENAGKFALPFRRHLAPLDVRRDASGWDHDSWDESTKSKALVVWTGRNLVRDMAAVLERRLIEAHSRSFVQANSNPPLNELPLRGWRTAPLASIAAFLGARTDDDRIAALTAGLAWARISARQSSAPEREDAVPFGYAALKPLFEPAGIGPEREMRRTIDPLPLARCVLPVPMMPFHWHKAWHAARASRPPSPILIRPATWTPRDLLLRCCFPSRLWLRIVSWRGPILI